MWAPCSGCSSCGSISATQAECPLQQILCKQMVLIQSAYKLIAMSLYSLVCGHFSQPVACGCVSSWPAGPANHTRTSLLCSLIATTSNVASSPNLQSCVHSSSIAPAWPPVQGPVMMLHGASPSLTSAALLVHWVFLGQEMQGAIGMDPGVLIQPC